MAESKSHKAATNRIADLYGAQYNQGKGADLKTPNIAIEVETPETVSDGLRQLQGHQGPVYIAGTNKDAVEKALEKTEGTTVGVMDRNGNIIKPSTRS